MFVYDLLDSGITPFNYFQNSNFGQLLTLT